MKRKAQNLLETSLMLCLIAIITLSGLTIYGKQQNKFVDNITANLQQASSPSINDTLLSMINQTAIPYNATVEPSEYTLLALNMGKPRFDNLISSLTEEDLTRSDDDSNDFFEMANQLSTVLNVKTQNLNENDINSTTLNDIVDLLNQASIYKGSNPETLALISNFTDEVGTILSSATGDSGIETAGALNSNNPVETAGNLAK